MIRVLSLLLAVAAFGLSGCTIHQSIGDNFGSYVAAPDGQNFRPVGYRWDYENTALMYVYRPATQWSMDELETPSFNVNGERLFNIKGGSYTWYELEPGAHDVVIRRGLFGIEGVDDLVIKKIAQLELDVKAGTVYYLRYSEIDPPALDPLSDQAPLGDGPLQLVAPSLALAELPVTKMLHRGRKLVSAPAEPEAEQEMQTPEVAPTENSYTPAADMPAESGGLKARPRTKAEDWWPF
jgi:hypothetical protein